VPRTLCAGASSNADSSAGAAAGAVTDSAAPPENV
jgi:hypothetical protein